MASVVEQPWDYIWDFVLNDAELDKVPRRPRSRPPQRRATPERRDSTSQSVRSRHEDLRERDASVKSSKSKSVVKSPAPAREAKTVAVKDEPNVQKEVTKAAKKEVKKQERDAKKDFKETKKNSSRGVKQKQASWFRKKRPEKRFLPVRTAPYEDPNLAKAVDLPISTEMGEEDDQSFIGTWFPFKTFQADSTKEADNAQERGLNQQDSTEITQQRSWLFPFYSGDEQEADSPEAPKPSLPTSSNQGDLDMKTNGDDCPLRRTWSLRSQKSKEERSRSLLQSFSGGSRRSMKMNGNPSTLPDDDERSWLSRVYDGEDVEQFQSKPARSFGFSRGAQNKSSEKTTLSRFSCRGSDDQDNLYKSNSMRLNISDASLSSKRANPRPRHIAFPNGWRVNRAGKGSDANASMKQSTKSTTLGPRRSDKQTKSRISFPSCRRERRDDPEQDGSGSNSSIYLPREGNGWMRKPHEVNPEPESSLLYSLFQRSPEEKKEKKKNAAKVYTRGDAFSDDSSLLNSVFGHEYKSRGSTKYSPGHATSTREISTEDFRDELTDDERDNADRRRTHGRRYNKKDRSRSRRCRDKRVLNKLAESSTRAARGQTVTLTTNPFAYSGTGKANELSEARQNMFQLSKDESWNSEDHNFLWNPHL